MNHVLLFSLLTIAGCSAPTLQQRQDAWRAYRNVTRATCLVGSAKDPAMPTEVRAWCADLVAPP